MQLSKKHYKDKRKTKLLCICNILCIVFVIKDFSKTSVFGKVSLDLIANQALAWFAKSNFKT